MWAMFERMCASPTTVRALLDAVYEIDITRVLPVISVPTQITHRRDDPAIPAPFGRYLAEHIPDANWVELSDTDHPPWLGNMDELVDAVEEFLTGAHHEAPTERVLTTVLFTDIVSSTERAAELGDARWRQLLERHDEFTAREVAAAGGQVVKSMGDGLLARFDGPGRAIESAHRIVSEAPDSLGIDVRAGIHTGECELFGDDLGGLAVHIGARVGAMAAPGEVLVSRPVRDLVIGTPVSFSDRGVHELKGVPGEWQILAAEPVRSSSAGRPEPSYEIAPNAALAKPSDRAAARLARTAPSLGRMISGVTAARARRRSLQRDRAGPTA
jgi:class 3 adenylate cyclase